MKSPYLSIAFILILSCQPEQEHKAVNDVLNSLKKTDSLYDVYLKDSADVEARIGLIQYSQDSTDVIKARTELPKERKDLEISRANYFNK